MIGYSDSAKDGGRLAANWALYRAQESIVDVCREAGVELTLFHGRGGSISRGGGPTYLAIQSQPPGSVDGRLRVTEQGEMIQAQFGLPDIAARTLELYTTATLGRDARVPPAPEPRWREEMDRLAETARGVYREVVYEDPRFIEYFRTATPEVELGTRADRQPPGPPHAEGGVDSLRAIPWVFAWTQTRLLLPSWLGTGEALHSAHRRAASTALLREMYEGWPFFRSTLDLIAMVLAESDARIAAEYDRRLVPHRCRTSAPICAAASTKRLHPCCRHGQGTAPHRKRRAAAIDRGAESLRVSDQPGADRAAAPPARGSASRIRRSPRRSW